MALRMRAVGSHAARLGEKLSRAFGVHGGRLGRAADNDWVLPDPDRYVSGHHAAIEYRGGQWYVLDTSSNGTYHNDSATPVRMIAAFSPAIAASVSPRYSLWSRSIWPSTVAAGRPTVLPAFAG